MCQTNSSTAVPEINPFMITSNQSYGIQLHELKMMNEILNKEDEPQVEHDEHEKFEKQHDLSFLYTRESDRIGEGVQLSDHPLAKQFRMRNERRKQVTCTDESVTLNVIHSQDQVKTILDKYNHAPKDENPLYSTTANVIGSKRPTMATHTAIKSARSQTFSRSFNRTMFRDTGLNVSLTNKC